MVASARKQQEAGGCAQLCVRWKKIFRIWILHLLINICHKHYKFLASQDALEVIIVTEWVSEWVSVSTDLTDVTLVSDDTYGDDEEDEEDEE